MELIKTSGAFSPDNEYISWLADLKERIRTTRFNIAVRANNQLILLYWSIGADIIDKHAESKWGDKLFIHLSKDIQDDFPGITGFSPRNLLYMKQMVELFSNISALQFTPQLVAQFQEDNESELTPQLVAQILSYLPWGHIRYILDKDLGTNIALFYACKAVEHGWSRSVLVNMIDAKLFESSGHSINNFKLTIPGRESDYANEIVDGEEFACDLLFYHLHLRRYVVVELKTVKFEPEFVSKVNFYCNAVNHLVKRPDEGDTIGLLICKEKNDLVAQWTLENLPIPVAISKYELSNLLPAEDKKETEE